MKLFHSRRWILIAGAAAALAACGGSDDDSFDDRADLADPKVRFVHAVPAGPAVTLNRNTVAEADATNVSYKYGSQYYDVGTDTYTFSLRTATGNLELDSAILDARRGTRYTFVALPDGLGAELLAIADPYNKSVASDNARVRVLHASPNAQAFDVYLTAPAAPLASSTPNFANLAYRQFAPGSGSDSTDFEAGSYLLRITPAGSKVPFFSATVTVPTDGDWLLVTLPEDDTLTNSVRVLLVRSDDANDATDEIVTQ